MDPLKLLQSLERPIDLHIGGVASSGPKQMKFTPSPNKRTSPKQRLGFVKNSEFLLDSTIRYQKVAAIHAGDGGRRSQDLTPKRIPKNVLVVESL